MRLGLAVFRVPTSVGLFKDTKHKSPTEVGTLNTAGRVAFTKTLALAWINGLAESVAIESSVRGRLGNRNV